MKSPKKSAADDDRGSLLAMSENISAWSVKAIEFGHLGYNLPANRS